MALTLKDLLQAQEDLRQREEQVAAPKESLSMAQLKELVVAQGSEKKESKSDKSLVKIFQEVKRQTKLLEQLVNISKDQSVLNNRENMQENRRLMERIADSLENLERTGTEPVQEKKTDEGIGLGGIATTLAVALGGLVGVVQGYVKALKTVGNTLYKGLVWVSDFFPALKKAMFNVEATFLLGFDAIKDSFKTFSGKLVKMFDGAVDFAKNMFGAGDKMSGVAKLFGEVKTAITGFFQPIAEAFKVIKDTSAPVGKAVSFIQETIGKFTGFFTDLSSKLSVFGKMFGAVTKIVSKLAYPLIVITTIWDTVKGALEGFEKDGIVGAISGAIKGLVNSLIMAPLDLLKDAVSWIAGAFGFDKVEEMLDSFSFEGLYSAFVDAIFSPIETLKSMFEGAVNAIQDIHIPEIGFTIPIIDKKVSIGPFYPFKSEETTSTAAPTAASTKPSTTTDASATVQPSAGTVSQSTASQPVITGGAPVTPDGKPTKRTGPELGTAPVLVSSSVVNNNSASTVSNASSETNQTNNVTRQSYEAIYNKHIAAGRAPFAAKMLADKETGLTGTGVSPVTLPSAIGKAPTSEAASVYEQSAQNAVAAIPSQTQQSTVVAPTTNISNTTQNQVIRMPVRNMDTSVMDYFKSRYA